MFATLIAAITGKARLWIEYAILALVIALGCAAYGLHYKNQALQAQGDKLRGDVTTLQGRVTTVEGANQTQEKTINDLVTQRAQDSFAVQNLLNRFDAQAAADATVKNKISKLEHDNAQVRDYRNIPLPADLKRVLNGDPDAPTPASNPDGNSKGAPASSAVTSVQTTQAATIGNNRRLDGRPLIVEIGRSELFGTYGIAHTMVQPG